MMKIASLSALLLGIVLDIQGCGGGCPSNDKAPAKGACDAASIATCMADADDGTADAGGCPPAKMTCCVENCCDESDEILPAELAMMSGGLAGAMGGGGGGAGKVKDAMDGMEETMNMMNKMASAMGVPKCKYVNPC